MMLVIFCSAVACTFVSIQMSLVKFPNICGVSTASLHSAPIGGVVRQWAKEAFSKGFVTHLKFQLILHEV